MRQRPSASRFEDEAGGFIRAGGVLGWRFSGTFRIRADLAVNERETESQRDFGASASVFVISRP
jgi:DNA-binding transcriptional regulator of glucitol operon